VHEAVHVQRAAAAHARHRAHRVRVRREQHAGQTPRRPLGGSEGPPLQGEAMRQLLIGLTLGTILGAVSVTLVAQRSEASYPDSVTADPKHYRIAFENDVARF